MKRLIVLLLLLPLPLYAVSWEGALAAGAGYSSVKLEGDDIDRDVFIAFLDADLLALRAGSHRISLPFRLEYQSRSRTVERTRLAKSMNASFSLSYGYWVCDDAMLTIAPELMYTHISQIESGYWRLGARASAVYSPIHPWTLGLDIAMHKGGYGWDWSIVFSSGFFF